MPDITLDDSIQLYSLLWKAKNTLTRGYQGPNTGTTFMNTMYHWECRDELNHVISHYMHGKEEYKTQEGIRKITALKDTFILFNLRVIRNSTDSNTPESDRENSKKWCEFLFPNGIKEAQLIWKALEEKINFFINNCNVVPSQPIQQIPQTILAQQHNSITAQLNPVQSPAPAKQTQQTEPTQLAQSAQQLNSVQHPTPPKQTQQTDPTQLAQSAQQLNSVQHPTPPKQTQQTDPTKTNSTTAKLLPTLTEQPQKTENAAENVNSENKPTWKSINLPKIIKELEQIKGIKKHATDLYGDVYEITARSKPDFNLFVSVLDIHAIQEKLAEKKAEAIAWYAFAIADLPPKDNTVYLNEEAMKLLSTLTEEATKKERLMPKEMNIFAIEGLISIKTSDKHHETFVFNNHEAAKKFAAEVLTPNAMNQISVDEKNASICLNNSRAQRLFSQWFSNFIMERDFLNTLLGIVREGEALITEIEKEIKPIEDKNASATAKSVDRQTWVHYLNIFVKTLKNPELKSNEIAKKINQFTLVIKKPSAPNLEKIDNFIVKSTKTIKDKLDPQIEKKATDQNTMN